MNVIVIVPDDHSRRAMGAYGDKLVLTPNFDQLAEDGILFTNAYAAAPVCSPSRAALLSGQYPSQVGVHDFLMLNEKYKDRGLNTSALIYPQVLKQNGYVTGMIGKWHLGTAPERHPLKRGFDYFVGYEQDLAPYNPILDVNGVTQEIKGHTSDIFVKYAKEFLNDNKDNQFSLNISFREPQRPWDQVPKQDLDAVSHIDPIVPERDGVDTEWLKKMTRNNYAAIHALDRAVGEVVAEVERLGIADKTIIFYVGDHGMLIGHHGYFGRGAVGVIAGDEVVGSENIANLYDEAIKIPMIIKWPGVVKENIVINTSVSNTDVYPTILSMLDINLSGINNLVGQDLTSFIKSENDDDRAVFAEYNMENFGNAKLRMVRLGDYKLIKRFGLNAKSELVDELYNLATDPDEEQNLIADGSSAQIIKRLEDLLYQHMKEINDPAL
ncbi:sulfatase [Pseudemcibacter aquimaris]|uniref:sulfatase family protein n=1 Tax=Pseudemcibacter aquimaris TaxID=2857064 RepID=UPI0020121312|nr:sulfatase-like hydrolase/transferase [Pseudemcibacter aquimaris]MCC3860307.1 sulfatase-like hydrolase/transferase [Pseudemcibacter aquimaris]WDU57631.1 sulfatase-like hydrolase/transferase [Pseudemcibacter aquimaris]